MSSSGTPAVQSPGRLDVAAIQAALQVEGLDGWLLYDFRGLNPIANDVTGADKRGGHLATRRWFYLIPVAGEPRALVHAIESHTLGHLPGTTVRYSGRTAFEAGLRQLLQGCRRVAMEYSPECAIPYIARVDAGTIELVRQCGPEVASSGNLVQQFSALWSAEAIATHVDASERLYRIKDRAFEEIARRTHGGGSTDEFTIQQLIAEWFRQADLVSDGDPNVSAAEHAGDPHYQPTPAQSRRIAADELVLLDIWGKRSQTGAVFADITWVGYTGKRVPTRFAEAFATIRQARDAAIGLVQEAARTGRAVYGYEVDRTAAAVIRAAGYGDQILHRTGHSLGSAAVHGTGVNMDDYETHDDRRLLPGTGFTVEPGIYFSDFGVRTEINMVMGAQAATVTGPLQTEILALA